MQQIIRKPLNRAKLLKPDIESLNSFKKKVGDKAVRKYSSWDSLPQFAKWIYISAFGSESVEKFSKKRNVICRVYPPNATKDIFNDMGSESVLYYSIGSEEVLRGDINEELLKLTGMNVTQDDVCREIYFRSEGSYFIEEWTNSLCYNFKKSSRGKYNMPALKGGRPKSIKISENKWTVVINTKDHDNVLKLIAEKMKGVDMEQIKEMFKKKESEEYKMYKSEIDDALDEF